MQGLGAPDLRMTVQAAYTDIQGLERLAHASGPEALRAAAVQFESLFLDIWLESMRSANAAIAEGSYLNSNEVELRREMLDHELAVHLAASGGIGLGDIIVRQLGAGNAAAGASTANPSAPDRAGAPAVVTRARAGRAALFDSPEAFARSLAPVVRDAVASTPLNPLVVLAQAALETGWGRHVIHSPEGRSSHNLFGIKAGAGWAGERVAVETLEVRDGRPRTERHDFRAYASFADAVADYVSFLGGKARYSGVLEAQDPGRIADELEKAGYATDPEYAEKLRDLMHHPVLRGALDALGVSWP